MVAMVMSCGIKIGHTRLLVHLASDYLVGGGYEGRKSSSHCSHGVVNFVQSMCVTCLVADPINSRVQR
jgi:hypothetical protein